MIGKKKVIFIIIMVLFVIGWQLGDANSGTKAIKRKAKEQASIYLENKYPDMEYKFGEVTFSVPNMLISNVGVETTVGDQFISFTVKITNKGEISDDYQEVLISSSIKRQIASQVNELVPNGSLDVITVRSGTEYFPYIYVSWEEALTKDAFLERCLAIKEASVNSTKSPDLITFACNSGSNYYVLKLDKEQMEYSKEKILEEDLIEQDK